MTSLECLSIKYFWDNYTFEAIEELCESHVCCFKLVTFVYVNSR